MNDRIKEPPLSCLQLIAYVRDLFDCITGEPCMSTHDQPGDARLFAYYTLGYAMHVGSEATLVAALRQDFDYLLQACHVFKPGPPRLIWRRDGSTEIRMERTARLHCISTRIAVPLLDHRVGTCRGVRRDRGDFPIVYGELLNDVSDGLYAPRA